MEDIRPLDIRQESIIDSFPVINCKKEVLNVGCGLGSMDYFIVKHGYKVYSTDYEEKKTWGKYEGVTFYKSNIFELSSFPVESCDIVICSEVLEHLHEYKVAANNLIKLSNVRVILTVPFEKSYNSNKPAPVGHCNWWNDFGTNGYKDIREFEELAKPYATSIQKIRTKPKDVSMNQMDYLIIIDKKQRYNV